MSQLGDPCAKYPHWHLGRLPDGVCYAVSRIYITVMSSKWRLLFSQTHLPPLSCAAHLSILHVEARSGCLRQSPVQLGKLAAHSYVVTFLQGRNHGLRKFFLALSCATLREGWQRSSEIVQFSLFSMPYIGFFSPSGVLEFLCWTTRLL